MCPSDDVDLDLLITRLRQAHDSQAARLVILPCSLCGYQLGYFFQHGCWWYDAGCWCKGAAPEARTEADLRSLLERNPQLARRLWGVHR